MEINEDDDAANIFLTFVIGALSFTTAFAWRDAVSHSFTKFVKHDEGQIASLFAYALVVTLVSIIVVRLMQPLRRIARERSKKGQSIFL